jgi:hypothetical protein
VERRCDGEEDRCWLELAARAKEGTRELGGRGRGAVRAGGAWGFTSGGGVTAGGNGGIMTLTPLKVGEG